MSTLTPPPTPGLEAAPRLIRPVDGDALWLHEGVLLAWDWQRALEPGEIFEILIAPAGGTVEHLSYSQALVFNAGAWFVPRSGVQFQWTVRVVKERPQEGETRPVSYSAPPFSFDLYRADDEEAQPSETPLATQPPTPEAATELAVAPQAAIEPSSSLFARQPGSTAMAFGPDARLYVLHHSGRVLRLRDDNGDQMVEDADVIFDDPDDLINQAAGIVFAPENGTIYLAHEIGISALTDGDADGLPETLTLLEGLPALAVSSGMMLVGPDGALYILVSDSGEIYRVS
jgi:glucose/arabinose dehydrogenase